MLKIIILKFLKLFPYRTYKKIERFQNILFTHWVKDDFAHFGKNSIIHKRTNISNAKLIEVGNEVVISSCIITAWSEYLGQNFSPSIIIGDNCFIGLHANISSINRIELKKNVLLGKWVTIIDHDHGDMSLDHLEIPPIRRPLFTKGEIIIEDDVWISDKVTICSNIRIGRGAVIGANSVVTKDVAPYTLVAGCPAKVIKVLK
ncbi:Virginiamycin A acetyltransferase [Elizabethkingia miricola]|nr:Virginiamycin A acetyltransferase [Elizabethkingia miricola]